MTGTTTTRYTSPAAARLIPENRSPSPARRMRFLPMAKSDGVCVMASIVTTPSGTFEIRFTGPDRKRRSFYTAGTGRNDRQRQQSADAIADILERLAYVAANSQPAPPDTLRWLQTLDGKRHAKLATGGLCEPRIAPENPADGMTLGRWVKAFMGRGQWKPGTLEQIENACRNLETYFGNDRTLESITPGDAEEYRIWLSTKAKQVPKGSPPEGLAHNTVRRRIGRAKELFAAAVRKKIIAESPFADEVAATGANTEKHQFIPADWIDRIIEVAPCEDWRIMLAFARYAGMRSHETRLQRWCDIDLPAGRMIVRSNKNPPLRVVPIFPELRPHLERAWDAAPEGADRIVTRYTPTDNIGTVMGRLIDRAGLDRWPDVFQNLRRSRETELMARYPVKDVAGWIGNSVPVAMKHYAMAMEDSFARAVIEGATIATGSNPPQNPPHIPPHSETIRANLDDPGVAQTRGITRKNPPQMTGAGSISYPART